MLRRYYQLTKPGIIYGNLLNASAGLLLAMCLVGHVAGGIFIATLVGIALVIAAACVVNNYIDRGIDKKMARTKQRSLVTGSIAASSALIYALLLGVLGFTVLILWTNALTVALGAIAIFCYLVPYSITKRMTVYGTLIGSVAGALPPVAGYCAITGTFDPAALLLFLIFAVWQMPHFYAIAMYRARDYAAAGLPVLPVKRGMQAAKLQSIAYIGAFVLTASLLTVYGYTGYAYLGVIVGLGGYWLWSGLRNFRTAQDAKWGRTMFHVSLVVVLGLDCALAVGALLP